MQHIELFSLFRSGMVLQRNKPIRIWGNAPINSIVTVSLDTFSVAASTREDGSFSITFPSMKEAIDCTLTVSCNVENVLPVVLADVAIGDVWLAGGQSNMEFFLRYDKDWDKVKNYENNPLIRVYNVPQVAFEGHTSRTIPGYGRWMQSDDPDFETFSAPGYSFARHLQPHIDVPIGIIGCNWGGTTATAWVDESVLEEDPLHVYLKEYRDACALYSEEEMTRISLEAWAFEDSLEHNLEFRPLLYGRDYDWQLQFLADHKNDPVIPLGPYNINRPGGLFHTMLEPLMDFAIKGAIWYQGESDAGHPDIYHILMERLISYWRKRWNDELPFFFVQLAPFGVWLECTSDNYALVRQKQEYVSDHVPNTGMVSIMDIGSYYDIHPKEKMEIGRRFALLARGMVYGENILCQSPRLKTVSRTGNSVCLTFDYCSSLTIGEQKSDWKITQNNTDLTVDSVSAKDNTITITLKEAADAPLCISLADADYAEIHIWNEAGLPLSPFPPIVC